MKRKRKSAKKLSHSSPLLWAVRGLTVFLFIVAGAAFVFPKDAKIPCANSISCTQDLSLNVENGAVGIFNDKVVQAPPVNLDEPSSYVLGDEDVAGEKHIYVDLATQTLSAYDGDELYMQTKVSTGKWNRTPTGDFHIWIKLRATRMTGGEGADYYDLPNVQYTMFFANDQIPRSAGYALHGAYWHNNFGHPMSHGCINMRTIDAKKLYDWANPITQGYTTYSSYEDPGTQLTIHGEASL